MTRIEQGPSTDVTRVFVYRGGDSPRTEHVLAQTNKRSEINSLLYKPGQAATRKPHTPAKTKSKHTEEWSGRGGDGRGGENESLWRLPGKRDLHVECLRIRDNKNSTISWGDKDGDGGSREDGWGEKRITRESSPGQSRPVLLSPSGYCPPRDASRELQSLNARHE